MASTSYRRVASFNAGGYNVNLESRTTANFTRSNNTISASSARVDVRFANDSVATSFTGFNVVGSYSLPQGSERRGNYGLGTGTWNRGNVKSTPNQSFSFSVGADATSVSTNNGAGLNSASWGGGQSMSIPALGAPSGTTTISTRTTNSISVRNDVTSWGTNATSGSVRSYIADNSNFSGQTYISTTDNALVNHTGLTSNKRYWFRGWAQNGGGKSSYHSSTNGYTLPLAAVAGAPEFLATSATIPYTQDVGGGAYPITTQYRLKQGSGAYGSWTTVTGGSIELSGLLPNTEYTVELRSTTTAGTTVGDTTTFTTLPAGKLIYPDGTVKNAIPRLVRPDGSPVEMVNINLVRSD